MGNCQFIRQSFNFPYDIRCVFQPEDHLKAKKRKILDKILLLSEKGVVVLVDGGGDGLCVFSFAKKNHQNS